MQAEARRPRTSHLDLAQRIIEVARARGFEPGARLPEQQLASLCNVSRTPVRAALKVLADRGVVRFEPETGYKLVADLSLQADPATELPSAVENDLAEAILRDRAARRLDERLTVSAMVRRYGVDRKTVLKSLTRLSEEGLVERAPGQSWLFRPLADGPDGVSESYEFRLALEPVAISMPGFDLDAARASALRQAIEALLALPDQAFDIGECQRLDREFHAMIAAGCANRFVAEALTAHQRLRRLPGTTPGVSVFRLRQSTREHVAILDQLESRQFEIAADLLRVHLRLSRNQRPHAAIRGAPVLTSMIRRPG